MNTLDSRHAIIVGSFDPLTLGHEDIIRRGAQIFERVTVGIGTNPDKSPLFSPQERKQMIADVFKSYPNVAVECFDGLAVDFVRECGGRVMLRGIRTLSDIEAEFTMSLTNRALDPDIETVFLMASERYTHISSTLIKQIAKLGKDGASDQLKDFVPPAIIEPLLKKYRDGSAST